MVQQTAQDRSQSVITQVFNGLSNVIKSAGTAIEQLLVVLGKGFGELHSRYWARFVSKPCPLLPLWLSLS